MDSRLCRRVVLGAVSLLAAQMAGRASEAAETQTTATGDSSVVPAVSIVEADSPAWLAGPMRPLNSPGT